MVRGISNSALGRHGTTESISQAEEGRGLQVGGRGVGCGRQRELLGRPQPLPDPSQRAAGDIAPPGQGAEKTATGGEEAAAAEAVAEAGFGVSLRSGGSSGGP